MPGWTDDEWPVPAHSGNSETVETLDVRQDLNVGKRKMADVSPSRCRIEIPSR